MIIRKTNKQLISDHGMTITMNRKRERERDKKKWKFFSGQKYIDQIDCIMITSSTYRNNKCIQNWTYSVLLLFYKYTKNIGFCFVFYPNKQITNNTIQFKYRIQINFHFSFNNFNRFVSTQLENFSTSRRHNNGWP